MAVRRPTLEQLRSVAESLSFNLSNADLQFFIEDMQGALEGYDSVDALPDYLPEVRYPRIPGYRPSEAENPLNAWYVKTEIAGAKRGKLSGKTVAIKDNIAVAGVQMMNGASTLEGYTPDIDATVVTRLLDAGATILGKAQCEYFCLSGGSHTGAQGPVRNPHNLQHSSGGSSSGCAALVANGDVDLAIGGDQGGSIRTPASYCGIVGLKPTWGLVPYTGAMPIELTIDHLGPMTRSVADNALMLEVLAGPDGLDPRQSALAKSKHYTAALGKGCEGLKIGVLAEGFGHPNSEKDVDASVRSAADRFRKLGAVVEDVSIPMHRLGPAIWTIIAFEGATEQMMKGNGHGFNWKGLYLTSLVDAHSAWRLRADELPDTVKQTMLIGEYMIQTGRGRYYAKAQNLARKLRAEYDAALRTYDVLLMPTTPLKAPPLPPLKNSSRQLSMQRATENMNNTFPFDVTSHPALSIPCAMNDGLPVGMMLVGRHFDETTLYRAAHAFEQACDWREFSGE
jgi:amidase